jgi:hypothetical protein
MTDLPLLLKSHSHVIAGHRYEPDELDTAHVADRIMAIAQHLSDAVRAADWTTDQYEIVLEIYSKPVVLK